MLVFTIVNSSIHYGIVSKNFTTVSCVNSQRPDSFTPRISPHTFSLLEIQFPSHHFIFKPNVMWSV